MRFSPPKRNGFRAQRLTLKQSIQIYYADIRLFRIEGSFVHLQGNTRLFSGVVYAAGLQVFSDLVARYGVGIRRISSDIPFEQEQVDALVKAIQPKRKFIYEFDEEGAVDPDGGIKLNAWYRANRG